MRLLIAAILVVLISCLAPHASGGTIQIDFSDNVGSYTGSQSPGHYAGDVTGTTWNLAVGDLSSLVWDDGTAATGVQLDVGNGNPTVNWGNTLPEASSGTVGVAIYDTDLMRDWHYTSGNANLGARVSGLAPGDYRVYALIREPNQVGRTYDAAIGVNISAMTDPGVVETTAITNASGITSWADGKNYAVTDVTVASTSDWLTVIVDPTNAAYGTLEGLQIVSDPPPPKALSIQFDVSDDSGSYDGAGGPAQAVGGLTGGDDNWNTVTGDVISGLVATDGSPAPGVSIDFGRQENDSGAINWNQTGSETGRSGGSDIYANELMRDWMYTTSDDNLGVRVSGLGPGEYDVFALVREYDASGRTYSVALGTDDDDSTIFDVDAGLIDPGLFRHDGVTGAPSTWTELANYFYQRVTIDDPNDYIVAIVDPTNAQYATLQGLQIVQVVPEPSTLALATLGLLGLAFCGRRRKR